MSKIENKKKKATEGVTKLMCVVIEYTRCCVKTKSKLTNLNIHSRIEGYNGK